MSSTATPSDDTFPTIACFDNGKSVIVYQSNNQGIGDGSDLYGVILDTDGTTDVSEFAINSYISDDQLNP